MTELHGALSDEPNQQILDAYDADRPAWEHRPWIVSMMITSLDGSTTVANNSEGLGNATDRALLTCIRRHCDAVLVGASTANLEVYRPSTIPGLRMIVAARSGGASAVDWERALWHDPRTVLLTTTESSPPPSHVQTLRIGTGEIDVPAMLRELRDQGIERLDCEGGPRLNAALAPLDVFDEFCTTLAPLVIGGSGSRIIDGGPEHPRRMRLAHSLQDGDYLFLRYLRDRSEAAPR